MKYSYVGDVVVAMGYRVISDEVRVLITLYTWLVSIIIWIIIIMAVTQATEEWLMTVFL